MDPIWQHAVHGAGDACTVTLSGELDMSTDAAPAYRAARRLGRSFTVTHAEGHVRRVLDGTGVPPTLTAEQAAPR